MTSSTIHRIAILISGRGSNMIALADAVRDGRIPDAEIVLVVSDKADAPGLQYAAERGIAAISIERRGRTRTEHEAEMLAQLKQAEVDLICLAGFMRLLSPTFINEYRGRILNIHPSLLPAFPGLHAQRQAIDYGVRWSGCTVHFVDEEVDHGAIIEQRIVPVLDDDTEETLAQRILVEEHIAYPQAVARIVHRTYEMQGRRVRRKNEGVQ